MVPVEVEAGPLVFSLLMRNGWWDISVLLCQDWDINPFLVLIRNYTRFHLGPLVNLSLAPPSSPSPSSGTWDQQQVLLQQLEVLRGPPSTVALVTFGCPVPELRRLWTLASRLRLPEFHWVVGDVQKVAQLRPEGLPLGLLAHGVTVSPSQDQYVQDALELVARAVGAAALENAALALIPATTNCLDQQQGGGSGEHLSR